MKLMSHNHAKLLSGILVALTLAGVTAHAQVLQLTGGDPSGGLTLTPANVIDALYTPISSGVGGSLQTSATQVFQGVTFSAVNANIARSGTGITPLTPSSVDTATNAGFTNSTPDTQDSNLLALMNGGLDFTSQTTPTALTLTISNLAPNTDYQIDSLISLLGYSANRTDTVAYNGGGVADSISVATANSHDIFDVQNIVESTAGGQIVVDYSGSTGPFYNALVVSSIPEPGTYAMLLGGLGLLFAWRRQRAMKA